MTRCACGKVEWELNGSRLVIATGTAAEALVTHSPTSIRIEHLPCQTCVTVNVG